MSKTLHVGCYARIKATGLVGRVGSKYRENKPTTWGIDYGGEFPGSELERITPAEYHAAERKILPHSGGEYWKHQSTTDYSGDKLGIDLFDDEQPGHTTIYVRYTAGLMPARSVAMNLPDHAKSVLEAWQVDVGSVVDHRTEYKGMYIV